MKIDSIYSPINIGKLGEKGVLSIGFDVSDWLALFPLGTFSVDFKPDYLSESFSLPPTQYRVADGVLTIDIEANITQKAGRASLGVRLLVGSTVDKRSAIIPVVIAESLPPAAGEMPEPVQAWIDGAVIVIGQAQTATLNANDAASLANEAAGLLDGVISDSRLAEGLANAAAVYANGRGDYANSKAGEANTAANLANGKAALADEKAGLADTAALNANEQEVLREEAEGLRASAEISRNSAEGLRQTAETSRETAEGLREGAETARETAEGLREGAETSRNTAEGLRDGAETSREEAEALRVAAEATRMGFKPMGAYNPANENKYGQWYTHEGGSYGYIWPEPSTGVPVTDTSHWQQIASQGLKGDKGDTGDQGIQGLKGDTGDQGIQGLKGDTGTTAFESAQIGGYTGSLPDFYADLARLDNMPPETWAEFQSAVRNGTIDRYFAAGDQFNVLKGGANLVFDIVDIGNSVRNTTDNGNAPTDPNYFTNFPNAKPVTFLMHDVIPNVMFDNSEANYQITTLIPSGTQCNITLESDTIASATYDFTAPSNLVVGGRLRISNATTLHYYVSPYTAVPTAITMVAGSSYGSIAASLSAQNHKGRVSYGSNKYTESAIRQWLNAGGAAASFWKSKSNYDLAPTWHSTLAGFRNGLDADFLAAIGETTREVELNTITDGGGHATISDNIFLPSRMEIFGAAENAGHKGLQYQAYVGLADIDKIKYDSTALSTARYWWLRSPYAGYAFGARGVNSTTGALGSGNAYNGYGAAAACAIL